jgi:hypothetical protein
VVVRRTTQYNRGIEQDELIASPAGDGMALVFFTGNPIAAVECAFEIANALQAQPQVRLRMGVHMGPVYRHADIREALNVAGGGINTAQRVMDCGDAGHILLSRTVAEFLEQFSGWRDLLQDLGEHQVKHGLRIHLYNLFKDDLGNRQAPSRLMARVAANTRIEADKLGTPSSLAPPVSTRDIDTQTSESPEGLVLISPEDDLRLCIKTEALQHARGLTFKITNDRTRDLPKITLLVRDVKSYDRRKSATRDAEPINFAVHTCSVRAGFETSNQWLAIIRADHLTFGNADSGPRLYWPNADTSPVRTWHLILALREPTSGDRDIWKVSCEFPIAIDWLMDSNLLRARYPL